MNFEKVEFPGQHIKRLEKEKGEKDWTYEKLQQALKFFIEKIWGDKFSVSGKNNIPEIGAAIIAINHSSHIDPEFLMAAIDRPIHFVGLQDKEFNPIYVKIFYKLAGVIGVSHNPLREGGKDFLKKVKEVIDNGELVGIFPEGRLEEKEKRDGIAPFKSGVFSIAKKYDIPVIPVYLSGTDKVRPDSQAKLIQKMSVEPVEVVIGEKLRPDNLQSAEDIRKAVVALSKKNPKEVRPEG